MNVKATKYKMKYVRIRIRIRKKSIFKGHKQSGAQARYTVISHALFNSQNVRVFGSVLYFNYAAETKLIVENKLTVFYN